MADQPELPDEVVLPPKGLLHYQSGPVVSREMNYGGQRWFVTWLADWDGHGWLVTGASSHRRGPAS